MSGLAEVKVKNQTGKFGEGYFELIALSGGASGGGAGGGGGGGKKRQSHDLQKSGAFFEETLS